MHYFLSDDKEILELSKKYMIELRDLRKPSKKSFFFKAIMEKRKLPIMLIVGTDCDTGKMTTAWEITKALKAETKGGIFRNWSNRHSPFRKWCSC